MIARRHTEAGVDAFREWLLRARAGGPSTVPKELLDGEEFTEECEYGIQVKLIQFKSRYQLAVYLDSIIPQEHAATVSRDLGFWTWLTAYYFEQLSPERSAGERKVGQLARYIPSLSDWRTYYRHLLFAPWQTYRSHGNHPELTKVVLSGTIDKPGELAEQLLARQEIVQNANALSVARKLYLTEADEPKRGSGGSGPGSPRRLAAVLAQFDRTYDLFSMPSEQLVSFLPREFDRFKRNSTTE